MVHTHNIKGQMVPRWHSPLRHLQHQRPSGFQINAFIWNLHKLEYIIFVSCTSLIWLLNCAPCADYCIIFYLTFELCLVCGLWYNFLTPESCAESCINAHSTLYPKLSEINQNLDSKSSFCFLGTFFSAGSYILEKFRWIVENSREFSRKKKFN